jgi:hypothetical protein
MNGYFVNVVVIVYSSLDVVQYSTFFDTILHSVTEFIF